MTILVPTDFSQVADNAISYAAMLAQKLHSKIILLHVIPPNSVWWTSFSAELTDEAKHKQQLIKEKLIAKGMKAPDIITRIINDYPLNKYINNLISEYKIDFVVMGTHGSSGLAKAKLGSFTLSMIDNVPIPVIAIPDGAEATTINNMLYPTDMEDTLNETRKLLPLAKALHAGIHIVHIAEDFIGSEMLARRSLLEVSKLTGYSQITTDVVRGKAIGNIIDQQLASTKAEMLVMFAHKKGFFEKLFKGSNSEQMSRHTGVPLLIFRKPD